MSYVKIKRKSDQKVFRFHFNNIGHGMWVVELIAVDDETGMLSHSDPFPNEREARQYTRSRIDTWYRDSRHGWCQRTGEMA